MKKRLFLIVFTLVGCTRPIGPNKYILKMSQGEQDSTGKMLTEKTQIDTISATNDTAAYTQVAKRFIIMLREDTVQRNIVTKVHTLEVTDWNGTPLRMKLSKKITDSIDNSVRQQMQY
jgi:hypothetical protein